jgi:hypothetical protein
MKCTETADAAFVQQRSERVSRLELATLADSATVGGIW